MEGDFNRSEKNYILRVLRSVLRVSKLHDFEDRSFSFESGVKVKRKILRVWSGLVCNQ